MYQSLSRLMLCGLLCTTISPGAQQNKRSTARPDSDSASQREGLTEPFRTIELAAPETGLILEINVEEGNRVREGQILARLDDLVLQASLAVAKAQKDATGQLKTAQAELRLRASRYKKLANLLDKGHATPEEVTLAESEKEVAEAKLTQAKEALRVKELEYERTLAQVERRLVRSPVAGIVTNVYRQPYEFVSYTEPVVMTVVQLDPIVAVFTFYPRDTAELRIGQKVGVNLASNEHPAVGTISYISPVLDAESGTVKVKVRIDNKHGRYRSGDKCTLDTTPTKIGDASRIQRK
ncbi:MAG: efflux RND transporter periplasmic adaptor subunit [Planctomycetaceae bacterium]